MSAAQIAGTPVATFPLAYDSGTALVAGAAQTVAVTGLSYLTPSCVVVATMVSDNGAINSAKYVAGVSNIVPGTGFTINLSAAAAAGTGALCNWVVLRP